MDTQGLRSGRLEGLEGQEGAGGKGDDDIGEDQEIAILRIALRGLQFNAFRYLPPPFQRTLLEVADITAVVGIGRDLQINAQDQTEAFGMDQRDMVALSSIIHAELPVGRPIVAFLLEMVRTGFADMFQVVIKTAEKLRQRRSTRFHPHKDEMTDGFEFVGLKR